jgi:hypothetical protein
MHTRVALLALLAVAASRGECGRTPPYDACAGKACGDACTLCPPDATDCAETAVVKACDPQGHCVPQTAGMCAATACAGKACGDDCVYDPPCRSSVPPCMMPSAPGHCDPSGACIPGDPPPPGLCLPQPPSWGCEGKACGDPCGYCPPETDPANCPVQTVAPTACDAQLQCVNEGSFTCPPPPSWGCVGKKCGDSCGYCPPDTDPANCPVPTFAATACDARLQCVTEGTFTCPP